MSKRILVAYISNSGSTEEVAREIAQTLSSPGAEVDLRRLTEVGSLDGYDAVVIGAPMILGWHRRARRFLKRNRRRLSGLPVALFMTALTVTREAEGEEPPPPVHLDPRLLKPQVHPGRLGFKERHTTLSAYLKPVLRAAGPVKPLGIGFFAGKLDYRKLKLFQMLFVMLVIGARPGDLRSWEAIRAWVAGLKAGLTGSDGRDRPAGGSS